MRILLIEDDETLCEAVACALESEGWTVDICNEGDDGLRWMRQRVHDLVLLDRMLPKISGVRLLETARKEGVSTPVLMVTALGAVGDRVQGLDAGADDYLVKPFALEELLARVRAMARRPRAMDAAGPLVCGACAFDAGANELTGPLGCCVLSRREGALLETLMRNKGLTQTREILLARVWGPDAGVEDGNLDNYIHFLRKRLTKTGADVCIRTVRGVGYKLEEARV